MNIKFREKSQITLPASVVEQLELRTGDALECEIIGNTICLIPISPPMKKNGFTSMPVNPLFPKRPISCWPYSALAPCASSMHRSPWFSSPGRQKSCWPIWSAKKAI